MRIDAVMWPDSPWPEAHDEWRLDEQLGIARGWVYDHLNLRPVHKRWHESMTFLAAAAASTERIDLGTMVTSPNFRHPAMTAKVAMTLHDISRGRVVIGVGAGGPRCSTTRLPPSAMATGRRGEGAAAQPERLMASTLAKSSRAALTHAVDSNQTA